MLKDSYDFMAVMASLSRMNANLSPNILNVKYLFDEFQDDMDVLSSFFADLKDRYGEFPWNDRKNTPAQIRPICVDGVNTLWAEINTDTFNRNTLSSGTTSDKSIITNFQVRY